MDMNVQYAAIEQMIAELRSFREHIDTRTHDVETKFAGLLADEAFAGLAAQAFNDARTAWDAKIQEMITNLNNIQTAVDVAQGEISATDSGLQGTFQVV
jgi:WXG100 family type VII secretion target